jgi:hypothetical protein
MRSKAAELFVGDVIKRYGKIRTIAALDIGPDERDRIKMLVTYADGERDAIDFGRRVIVLASDFGGMARPFDCRSLHPWGMR